MFESVLLRAEQKHNVLSLIIITYCVTFVLGIINYFLGGNALFLVALSALALAYPLVNYILEMDKEELEANMSSKNLFKRHSRELTVFWSVFIGLTLAMYALFVLGMVKDFTYQQLFIENVSGMITNTGAPFSLILVNNLQVAFFTFIISIIAFSGLIFVLSWNASLLAYYLYSLGFSDAVSVGLRLLPHGLLEMGGYILVGIAGSLFAFRIEKGKRIKKGLVLEFYKDFALLLILGIALVIVGAIVETL